MTAATIGSIITALLAIFGWWIKWKLSKAARDRQEKIVAEKTTEDMRMALKKSYESNAAHTDKIIEITSGNIDIERVNQLLSRPIDAAEIPTATSAKNS